MHPTPNASMPPPRIASRAGAHRTRETHRVRSRRTARIVQSSVVGLALLLAAPAANAITIVSQQVDVSAHVETIDPVDFTVISEQTETDSSSAIGDVDLAVALGGTAGEASVDLSSTTVIASALGRAVGTQAQGRGLVSLEFTVDELTAYTRSVNVFGNSPNITVRLTEETSGLVWETVTEFDGARFQ